MLVRIVKLTLQEDRVEDFKTYFDSIKDRVRNSPGCSFLEVYQDLDNPNVFFTYSYWNEAESLEQYRHSNVFLEIWPYVKTMFAQRAEAWSVNKYITLN